MAKRGRKPKDKKDYFSEVEENAVAEYIELNREASGYTCRMLEIILGCGPDELSGLCSGLTFEIIDAAKDIPGLTKEEEAELAKLKNSVRELSVKKNEIYNNILHPAFVKMIESIIRRYKLYVPDEEFVQTFNDVISYLMTKIHNFKPAKGKKAYSYCGTVCKNRLTYKNIQYTKEKLRSTSFDEHIDELTDSAQYTIFNDDYSKLADKLIKRSSAEIQKMINAPEENQLTDNEVKVGMALVELLNNWEELLLEEPSDSSENFDKCSNKLQKSKVLYFLREETMMNTKEVRDNMKKFKTVYGLIKKAAVDED